MIDCPKCGFNQPEDQYCANCGVDMYNYKPPQKPFLSRLLSSPNFYITILLIALAAVSYYISQNQLQSTPQEFQEDLQAFNTDPTATNNKQDFIEEASLAQDNPGTPTETNAFLETQAKKEETQEPTPEKKAPSFTSIEIAFFEVAQNYLDEISSSSQLLAQNGDLQTYSLNKETTAQTFINNENTSQLRGGSRVPLTQTNPIETNFTYFDETDGEFGLKMSFSLTNYVKEKNSLSVELESILRLKGDTEVAPFSNNISGTYELDCQTPLVMFGILPRTALAPSEASQLQNNLLALMSSDDFLSSTTDLALIIYCR